MKRKKLKSISQLKKIADITFSRWIRLRDSVNGNNVCFTCGAVKTIKELQCGHYISRTHLATRYDEQNCHPQDIACNLFKKGAMDAYAINLVRKYGTRVLEELDKKKHTIKKITRLDYEEIIKKYGTNLH